MNVKSSRRRVWGKRKMKREDRVWEEKEEKNRK